MFCLRCLYCRCGKALFQIGDDVVDVLRTDGETDGIRVDVLILELFCRELGVGGGGRVNDQALHIGDVCQQRENFQRVDESVSLLHTALDVKGEDGRPAVGEVFLEQRVIRMIGQRGMVDLLHLRVIGQKGGQGAGTKSPHPAGAGRH